MLFWAYFLSSALLSGVSAWLYVRLLGEHHVAEWLRQPWLGTTYGVLGIGYVVFSGQQQLAIVGGAVFALFFFMNILFAIPIGLAGFSCWGSRLGDWLSNSKGGDIRPIASFDQALAAESRGQLELAEKIYLQSFKLSRKRGVAEADLGDIRLSYGNLLKRMARPAEAADQWEKAAECSLLPERAQMAAIRTVDLLVSLGQAARARKILVAAIDRHPREAVTAALRERLSKMS